MSMIHFESYAKTLPANTLFIHGNLASNRWWKPAIEIWQKKATPQLSGRLVAAEFRGCGKSPNPQAHEIDMHLFAEDFIALVKKLDCGKFHLVGHSTGGLIAALMLAKAPELFGSAVLLDPVGAEGVKFEESMTAAFEAMKKDKNLVATVLGSTIHNNKAESALFKELVEDAFHAVNTVGAGVLKALDGFDVTSLLKKIANPVLVLHGEHDLLLPVADSQKLSLLMKNARFEVIAGQGHCTNVENPEKFVEIINRFLFL